MSDQNISNETSRLTSEAQIKDRRYLLEQFSERPTDDSLWQAAYERVRAEGDQNDQQGIASDIPAEELITLANTVRNTPQLQRYDLMTAPASNGKLWFDVLETFTSEQLAQAKRDIISSWVNQTHPPTGFEKALDLGTGTGKSLGALEGNAEKVVGIDRNAKLLAIAKEKAGPNTKIIQSEVDKLPFGDSSFDLATSSGLTGSLDKETLRGLYTELARVLKTNGVYIEVSPWPFDGYVDEEDAKITASSKAMLADMVVDTVSGKHQLIDRLGSDDQVTLLESLGLELKYYDVPTEDGMARNLLTVITKTA